MYYGYHSRPLKNKIRTNRSWAVSRMVVASLGMQGQFYYRLVCLTRVGVVATHPTYTLLFVWGEGTGVFDPSDIRCFFTYS